MKNRILIPALLFLHLLFCQVLCERLCYELYVPLNFDGISVRHVDNSGASPQLVQSGMTTSADAYGMRLFLNQSLQNPKDSLVTDECGLLYELSPPVIQFQVFNLTPMSDTIPPGSDVTEYFEYHSTTPHAPKYLPLRSILWKLNETNDLANLNRSLDILCTKAIAKNSWYQFRICLTQSDSSSTCIQSDSIFLK